MSERQNSMTDQKQILHVLAEIAHVFNREQIHWALGASMLLYFNGKTDVFHDIDLMVSADDAERARELLLGMQGEERHNAANAMYRTKYFYEFVLQGVDIDLMAGMIIVHDGKEEDCSLREDKIERFIEVEQEQIPLYSLKEWRQFYTWMGREKKVEMMLEQ